LLKRDFQVTVLTRQEQARRPGVDFVRRPEAIGTPVDGVINLAGASLADRRWSEQYKAQIVASRVGLTERLVDWMRGQLNPPKVLLSGSAVGYYGASRELSFDESSLPGRGFSAQLCQAWESAAGVASSPDTRVVSLRLGVVFDRDGGALNEMMRSFQLGIGSWMGDGAQWLSWVHRIDVVRSILFLLDEESASGPYNIVAPLPVTHRDFCGILSARKRTLFNAGIPAPIMRLMLGEMADELLLTGQRVQPDRLLASGFEFRFASLDSALIDILSRTKI